MQARNKRMRRILDDNYPPALTGTPETDFNDEGDAQKADAELQADSPLLASYTGTQKTLPTGDDYLDWFIQLIDDAGEVFFAASPTTAELQDAADNYKTVAAQMGAMVSAYT